MGSVVDDFTEALHDTYDFIEEVVSDSWDYVAVPILEEIFSWFGIEDEEVVVTQKISTLLFEDNTIDVVKQANVKAVISMMQNGGSFFNWYSGYTDITRTQIEGFYRFAKNGRYIHGLPTMEIKGGDIDFDAIDTALDTALGFAATRLSVNSRFPHDDVYFKHKHQSSPYNYIPSTNFLTFTDPYGVSRNDYTWDSLVYNAGNDTYDISISRIAEHALFWIEGPVHIVEGDSATYTIKCNRTVPTGKSVTINFAYAGTAPEYSYTAVATAVMPAGDTEVSIIIDTGEEFFTQGNRTLTVIVDSITNTGAAFESVGVHTQNSATTTITDDEGIILTLSSHIATEAAGSVTIPVKLENDAGGAFTVDYAMTDITATGGVDYDNTPGTLNFTLGTAGEVQNIVIPITSDSPDDNEVFIVHFTACSDATVDFSQTSTVTISDDSTADPAQGTAILSDVITEPGFIKEHSLIVTYHKDTDPSSNWFYWIYKYSDGTFNTLDSTVSYITNLEVLPLGILRRDKINVDADKTSQEYKTTSRLLATLGLNIDEVLANIEENPDKDSIDDLFINFAINPLSTPEVVSKILWLTFHNFIVIHQITSSTDRYSATLKEQDVETAVAWTEHSHTTGIAGTIPGGGEYSHEIVITQEIKDEEGEIIQEGGSVFSIRKQTSPGFYSEISVSNLNGIAAIAYEGFHKIAFNKIGDDNFTIPVSYYLINQLDRFEQMHLYQHIFRIDAHAIQIIHLEWYETSQFATLFEFAMIAISVASLGSATGPLEILKQLIFSYLIMELVVYLAELTGNAEFAAIVGLVAMIALGDATGMTAFDFTSAEGLILASTNFANNLAAGYGVESEGLREDMIELNEMAEARLEGIKEATPEESPITTEFLVALNSVETTVFPAVKAQYDFDLLYNYDRIIKDYYDINLLTGVN